MTRSVTLLFGGHVFVCGNGMIIADHKLKTRHTLNVWDRIPELISRSVYTFGETISNAQKRNDRPRDRSAVKPPLLRGRGGFGAEQRSSWTVLKTSRFERLRDSLCGLAEGIDARRTGLL
jgi:hypothetical protein